MGIDAENLQIVTDMGVSSLAGRAFAAVIQRAHDNFLPELKTSHAFAEAFDHARHLMANHTVVANARIHIAVVDVHIGAANPAIGDANGRFPCPWAGLWCFLNREGFIAAIICSGHQFCGHGRVSILKFSLFAELTRLIDGGVGRVGGALRRALGRGVDGGGEPEPLPAYYDGIDVNATGATLANALQMLLTTTHDDLNYDEVIDAYTRTDSGRGTCSANEIFDFYSDRCWNVDDDCGQYNSEGDCYNREHSWPKSWWGGSEGSPAYADLFHVVPADGWVNNQRGNLPFGDVDNPTYTSSNGSKKGPCASPGFSGDCFEPTDDVKGDLARGYFYMALRYDDVFTCCGRDGVDRADIEPWMEDVLRAWHTFDPVDDDERARNNAVFIEQGNRNPFIDHPSWVSAITDF